MVGLLEGVGGKIACVYTHISTSTNFIKILDLVINSGRAPLPSFPAFQLSGGKGCVNHVHEVCRGEEHYRWYVCVMCAL